MRMSGTELADIVNHQAVKIVTQYTNDNSKISPYFQWIMCLMELQPMLTEDAITKPITNV
jgi:hypothetical protein